MQSGIKLKVSEDAVTKYTELRMKKMYRYIIFKIDEDLQEIMVEKTGAHDEEYETFTTTLPENDCRFIIYDLDFETGDHLHKSKIFFISWSPDTAKIKARMMYASSRERFKEELEGVHYEAQATDPTELDKRVLLDRVLAQASRMHRGQVSKMQRRDRRLDGEWGDFNLYFVTDDAALTDYSCYYETMVKREREASF